MSRKLKKSICAVCGAEFIAKDRKYKPTCSVACGIARVQTVAHQMRFKQGEYYHKWRDNLRRHFELMGRSG